MTISDMCTDRNSSYEFHDFFYVQKVIYNFADVHVCCKHKLFLSLLLVPQPLQKQYGARAFKKLSKFSSAIAFKILVSDSFQNSRQR